MRERRGAVAVTLAFAGLVTCPLVGCSPASDGGTTCGTTRTAADVPVMIKVAKGNVDCQTAMTVENRYTTMIRSGQVKGNGGGSPVAVDGWTCQGYPTPELLRTGDTSQCRSGGEEILAVLPAPTPTPTAS
ncbi:MAG: hypothetical protein JO345_39355 [Streptosporangiaceae bacterium]|nr:hypothetical protein [Streptosporangiaceae bacterium]